MSPYDDYRRNVAVVFVSSSGGVLPDVQAVADGWPDEASRQWVVADADDTRARLAGSAVEFWEEPTIGTSMLKTTIRAAKVIRRLDAKWVVSAGTAIALPWFVAARVLGVRTLWIETLNIHGTQGRVAAICSRLAYRTVVQRPDRLVAHKRSVLLGELQ